MVEQGQKEREAFTAAETAYLECFPDAVGVTFDGLHAGIKAYESARTQQAERTPSDSRWEQAGEVFRELQAAGEAGVDMYVLHQKYRHSPAMLSWFTRTFFQMVSEREGWLFLRQSEQEPQTHQAPQPDDEAIPDTAEKWMAALNDAIAYRKLKREAAQPDDCLMCNGKGWYSDADPRTGDEVQVQCEPCYGTGKAPTAQPDKADGGVLPVSSVFAPMPPTVPPKPDKAEVVELLTRIVVKEARENGADSPVDYGDAEQIVRALLSALPPQRVDVEAARLRVQNYMYPNGMEIDGVMEAFCAGLVRAALDLTTKNGEANG
jgi:hypothetical protein